MEVGEKLKRLRKERGLTLQALADKSGLSVSYLSNVEREATSPTLQHLGQICQALDILIADFLTEPAQEHRLYARREEFEPVFRLHSRVQYELALCGNPPYKCVCITMQGGGEEKEYSMGLPEGKFLLVTQGSMRLEMEGMSCTLHPMDVALVPAHTPHTYANAGEEPCISYWFSLAPAEPSRF